MVKENGVLQGAISLRTFPGCCKSLFRPMPRNIKCFMYADDIVHIKIVQKWSRLQDYTGYIG